MHKLLLATAVGLTLLAVPVANTPLPIGATTAHAQNTNERIVRTICRTTWSAGKQIVRCYRAVSGALGNVGNGLLGIGVAGKVAHAMGGNRSVPHEWWPYRSREDALYHYARRDQLGRNVHGPLYVPRQDPYWRARQQQLGHRQGPANLRSQGRQPHQFRSMGGRPSMRSASTRGHGRR